jgi:hypothetical protein
MHEIRCYSNIKLLEITLQSLSVKGPSTSVPADKFPCFFKKYVTIKKCKKKMKN